MWQLNFWWFNSLTPPALNLLISSTYQLFRLEYFPFSLKCSTIHVLNSSELYLATFLATRYVFTILDLFARTSSQESIKSSWSIISSPTLICHNSLFWRTKLYFSTTLLTSRYSHESLFARTSWSYQFYHPWAEPLILWSMWSLRELWSLRKTSSNETLTFCQPWCLYDLRSFATNEDKARITLEITLIFSDSRCRTSFKNTRKNAQHILRNCSTNS